MLNRPLTYATMPSIVGQELGVSSWTKIDQHMIDQFAETTHDKQWIHVDVERSERESPFKAPIAHGFLTLSLVPSMTYEIGAVPEGTAAIFNYGLDRVRFLSPVKAGSRVRMRSTLVSFEEKGPGQYLMKTDNVIEIEGEEKPALIAESLLMFIPARASKA